MFVDFNILNQLGSPSINSNTFANRPSAGQVGRLFVSTDTFEIYRDTGTGWDLIGGPGSSTVTGSGAAGQVTYWTGTNSVGGENNLWWDAANNHLGINTSTPGVALDVHSAADVGVQLNGTGATPSILQAFLSAGVSQYEIGYNWNSDINYRRFSIYDVQGSKEVISIDQQSRFVGINYQYSSLTDQPAYTLDVSGQIRGQNLLVNSNGQTHIISNYFGAGTDGKNFYIGGGGLSSSGTGSDGSYNVSLGIDAMLSNTTGQYNVAIGFEAMKNANGANYENIAIGYNNLQNITTGYQNTCVGGASGFAITTGYRNTSIGSASLFTATTGYFNVAAGRNALRFLTTGYQNVAIGNDTLFDLTTGFNNTAIGYQAGQTVSTGSSNVYIGNGTVGSSSSVTNEISIGTQSTGNGSNSVTLGNSSITKTILRGNTLIGTTVDAGQNLQVSGTTYLSSTVGINNTSPSASAILDISSTTQGVAIPRMTATQRAAISTPTTGLAVYNTTNKSIDTYDTSWLSLLNNVNTLKAFQALGSEIKALSIQSTSFARTANTLLVSQTVLFVAVYLANKSTITGACYDQNIIIVYTGNNYNGVGLYTYSGGTLTLVASSTNDANFWLNNQFQKKAFSSTYDAEPGVYYLGFLYCASSGSAPGLNGLPTPSSTLDFTNSAKSACSLSGQTALPSSLNINTTTAVAFSPNVAIY